jgi:hypothetical protein
MICYLNTYYSSADNVGIEFTSIQTQTWGQCKHLMLHLSFINKNVYYVVRPHQYNYCVGKIPAVAYNTEILMQMGCDPVIICSQA